MERDGEPIVERVPADEAFSILGNETRLRILTTLNEADRHLSFSELRHRVGVDDPGGFNYHLGKLKGQFVSEADEGYAIAPPGERVVGAVLSGGYTAALSATSVPVDGNCLHCGAPLEAVFREHGIAIDCTECEWLHTNPEVPAGLMAGYEPESAPDVVARWNRLTAAATDVNICMNCRGSLRSKLHLSTNSGAPDWLADSGFAGMVFHECERCGHTYNGAVQYAVLTHPAVVAFHYEHGIDLRETSPWELEWMDTDNSTVESGDPVRIAVPMTLDAETRTFVFDRELDVVEERRT